MTNLLKECARMHKFDHPNVLKLSGVCLDGGPAPYIIMPFMANGSLLSFLKEERENLVLDPGTPAADTVKVCILAASGQFQLFSGFVDSKRGCTFASTCYHCVIGGSI